MISPRKYSLLCGCFSLAGIRNLASDDQRQGRLSQTSASQGCEQSQFHAPGVVSEAICFSASRTCSLPATTARRCCAPRIVVHFEGIFHR